MSDLILLYGKFKGKQMHEIPSGYLKWMAENIDDETICEAADWEYQHRESYNVHWWD